MIKKAPTHNCLINGGLSDFRKAANPVIPSELKYVDFARSIPFIGFLFIIKFEF